MSTAPPEPDATVEEATDDSPADAEPRDDVLAASSLIAEVAAYPRRREESRRRGSHGLWSQVAYVGALGWMMALPVAGGAIGGHYLDQRLDVENLQIET